MDFLTKLFTGAQVKEVSPSEAQKKLTQKPKPFLLDVRQPEEFRTGHIPGAKLIPLGELHTRIHEVPRNQEILCVCHSGNRSLSATRQLAGAGYNVINLRGGMIAWSRSGLPVTNGKA
jgi:rhodanese-related sulfurtransferase